MNSTDFLSISGAICPDRAFMIFDEDRWTFAQVNERVNRLANSLAKLGIEKGDRIGMLQVNCNQFIETYFAAAKLGAIFVPLNFKAKSEELTYMLSNAEAKILFAGSRYLDMVASMMPDLPTIKECIAPGWQG